MSKMINIDLYPEREQVEIERLTYLIEELKREKSKESESLINLYQEKLDKIVNTYEDSIKFWTTDCMNKYWKVKFADGDYLIIYPYKSNLDNGTLWGVFRYLDNYHSGLTDGCLPIIHFIGRSTEHIELSGQEFTEIAYENIEIPLITRLKKLGLDN